ncbi:pyruvate kinase [Natronospirillum operosum]|uniref:Pyruvate kinase n=1 Tax=Natronospirillum operosum TaxID=2759953 RepID=A0A4Z0WC06_9GAMM|nr:pyruvate kinase [Natronospirillum operosum]TGG95344.1 pyruvate kinase [Natronospirillum operosum]
MPIRRTKIVTTLGPATDAPGVLEQLILAGANVVRLNFSHGSPDDHRQRVAQVRELSARHGRFVGIMADLQGPKIRIAGFADGSVMLSNGQTFTLDLDLDRTAGTAEAVGVDYPALAQDSRPGDFYLLDDGRIRVEVTRVDGNKVQTRVVSGGTLSSHKGINKKGGGLSAHALTDRDREDIRLACELEVDFVAVSFPRSAEDIEEARALVRAAGGDAWIVAKIERAEAVQDAATLDAIVLASDVVMVARGDLGVEIGDAELIGVQKKVIQRARDLDRVVITATQMMETMISNPYPTRAEVFDVANAVLDGTDAVMCSAETAVGAYPVETVRTMAEVCIGAEKQRQAMHSTHRIDQEFRRTDEAIAMSVMYAANHLRGVKAIVCVSESGATPLWMSRISSGLPIFAMTRHQKTARRVCLFRGVEALHFDVTQLAPNQINQAAVDELKKADLVRDGDLVIISKGDHMGILGGTNSLKIVSVGNIL